MVTGHAGRWTRIVVALAAAVTMLAACSGGEPADPSERLAQAMERTFEGSFQYRIAAVSDRDALEGLGAEARQVAQFLNAFSVAGTVNGDVTSLEIRAVTTTPAFEIRRFAADDVFIRLGITDLLGPGLQVDLEERILPAMVQLGIPRTVRSATTSLFSGQWVSVQGEFDGDLGGLLADEVVDDPSMDPQRLQEDLGGNLPGFVRRFVTVDQELESDGQRRYTVDLQLRALLRTVGEVNAEASIGGLLDLAALEEQLATLPEQVAGEIVVQDGLVTSIRFDVAAAARDAGQDVPGTIQLRFDISEHGQTPELERPDTAVVVPSDDLATALRIMLENPLPQPTPTEEAS
jgi:hypothetical protein